MKKYLQSIVPGLTSEPENERSTAGFRFKDALSSRYSANTGK
jgi:hypothetical protein